MLQTYNSNFETLSVQCNYKPLNSVSSGSFSLTFYQHVDALSSSLGHPGPSKLIPANTIQTSMVCPSPNNPHEHLVLSQADPSVLSLSLVTRSLRIVFVTWCQQLMLLRPSFKLEPPNPILQMRRGLIGINPNDFWQCHVHTQ